MGIAEKTLAKKLTRVLEGKRTLGKCSRNLQRRARMGRMWAKNAQGQEKRSAFDHFECTVFGPELPGFF
jgi:hypothetical protein